MSIKIKIKPSFLLNEKVRVKGLPAKISKFGNKGEVFIKYTDEYDIEKYGNDDMLLSKNDIKKNIRNDIFVSPSKSTWVVPEKKEFVEWVNKTFYYDDNKISNEFTLFKQQKFVRDYLQKDSPYRGLLLYHGLGSGKTCASIAIAENLKEDKNIIVVLPASLKSNFEISGLKKCGSESYKGVNGDREIEKYYKFISLNSRNALKTFEKLGNIDNSVVIIDEVHNLISRIVSSIKGASSQGKGIYDFLMSAKNVKYVFLSGIPLVNSIFEAGIICNLLHGYIELHIFDILKISGVPNKNTNLAQLKTNLEELKFIVYLNINSRNNTIELTTSIKKYEYDFDECVDIMIKAAKSAEIDIKYNDTKEMALFPETEETFDKYFIQNKNTEEETLINKNMLSRRMLGLISYYKSEDDKSYPTLRETQIINVPMSDYQFTMYQFARDKERNTDKKIARAKKKSGEKNSENFSKSVFRIFSRMISNFSFPKEFKRFDFIKDDNKNIETNGADGVPNLLKELDIEANGVNGVSPLEDEKKISIRKKKIKKMKETQILSEMKKKSDIYLTMDALSQYSPKMKKMIEMIINTDGLILIYSTFVSIEGIKIFSDVLEQNGFTKYNNKNDINKLPYTLSYTLFTGVEKDKEKEKSIETFNLEKNKNGDIIKVLLISSSGAEGLDLRNVRNVFIMEPHWNEARISQVIGRARRKNSHMDLPKEMRYVNIYRFHSVLTDKQKSVYDEEFTSDEHIFKIAKKKEKITEETLNIMKNVAVDCKLHAYKNCFTFGKNATGLSYLPKIREDEIYSQETRTVTKKIKLIRGGITKDNKVVLIDGKKKKVYYATDVDMIVPIKNITKLKKKVFVDVESGNVYDAKSATGSNPIIIGKVNENSYFVK
jgi:superfamily II DNA or RNA helicase